MLQECGVFLERARRHRGAEAYGAAHAAELSTRMSTQIAPELNALTYEVIGIAMEIHTEVGSGMREGVYEKLLATRLRQAEHNVAVQHPVRIQVGRERFDQAFRVDLLVDDVLVIEVKAATAITAENIRQVASYLRFMKLDLGLILNFGAGSMRQGVKRVINAKR